MTGYLMTAVNALGLTFVAVLLFDVRNCPLHGPEVSPAGLLLTVADDTTMVTYDIAGVA